ncbi:peptidase C1B bleomycin hydrolase [Trametes versicolor FP-101664 SS1]|uniref:peptidase C1B bleomycin hydrolase n=1 Tax=Trametes versicolor (strain FP-101664) TaxID=717944 RepID=UPI000462451B|nr:peptidase C1B bleomycin hydrolase [Trametes versicolor FP-101664 SS1]EIW63272.1 peptidase C1B bleomycin hydrolase [Trametes versicolor FP-101664 SS1]
MGSAPSKTTQAEQCESEKATYVTRELAESLAKLDLSAPLSVDGSLSLSNVDAWEDDVTQSPKLQLARTILNHTNIRETLTSRSSYIADAHVFNTELEFKTSPITNQKSSGRCWLFATTNVLRYNIMKKLNLSEFQLSQSYLFFWDKLNKSNYYLELAIQHADLPVDDRLVYYLADELISDGGQWDMAVNLLETYGVIPQPLYPESLHSSLSSPVNTLLKTKLREHALILRDLSASLRADPAISADAALRALRSKKEALLKEVYVVMSATLGVPPRPDEKQTWDYYDKDGKPGSWTGTPREFYKAFAYDKYSPADSFSLINDPRNEYGKLYTVDKLGNIWGGRPVLYVNTEIENLKQAVVKQLKAGQPVFFGCDVGQFSDRNAGVMDTALFEYEAAFDIKFGLTKADRLHTSESSMTHAMVISGVHLDAAGRPARYKVENSWGDVPGDRGYFVMSDAWFEQFVYQVVVPKALAPKDLVAVFDKGEAQTLPPWDPMGSLA